MKRNESFKDKDGVFDENYHQLLKGKYKGLSGPPLMHEYTCGFACEKCLKIYDTPWRRDKHSKRCKLPPSKKI